MLSISSFYLPLINTRAEWEILGLEQRCVAIKITYFVILPHMSQKRLSRLVLIISLKLIMWNIVRSFVFEALSPTEIRRKLVKVSNSIVPSFPPKNRRRSLNIGKDPGVGPSKTATTDENINKVGAQTLKHSVCFSLWSTTKE